MSEAWMIIGCGYTGTALARALVGRGADLTITRRDGEAAVALGSQLGARGIRVELGDPASLAGVVPPGAIVVCCAPPAGAPAGEMASLAAAMRDASRLVYVSSTGVYAPGSPGDGAIVDEGWPIAPTTKAGHARVLAETALAACSRSWIALRAAGIYGPGRGLVERIRAGSYRVVGDGSACVSRIHVVDLVAAIIAAGTSDVRGAVNIADDDPAPIGVVADAVAAHLGLPPPRRVSVGSVGPEIAGMLTANRRIANARMKAALGVSLAYPSWRTALAELPHE